MVLDKVTLGSAITNTEVTVTINAKLDQKCYLKLLDDYLISIQISEISNCNGIISLNQFGNYALESKIQNGSYKFGVVFVDKPTEPIDFIMSNYHISYKEPTYFAEIKNNKVTRVIVADQDYINSIPGTWIETKMDGSIRGTYASIGFDYDIKTDQFIPPVEEEIILLK